MKRRLRLAWIVFISIVCVTVICKIVSGVSDNKQKVPIIKMDSRPGITTIPANKIHARNGDIGKTVKGAKYKNQTEYEKALYQFRYRIIVDSYKKYGYHNPAWDDKAIKFLEKFTQYKYEKDNKLNSQELTKDGKAVIDAGCNDPMVLSRYAMLSIPDANKYMQLALKEFEKSKYPKGCIRDIPFYMYVIEQSIGQSNSGSQDKWRKEAIRLTAEALDDGSYLPGEQRFVLDTFLPEETTLFTGIDDELPNSEWVTVFTEIKDKKNIDPYIYNVVGAHYLKYAHIKVDTSNPDPYNWVKNDQGAEMKSRDMLIKAWKLHPEYPEAPAILIRTTLDLLMTGKRTEDPRVWHDRSVAAQFDYKPAYYLYTAYLDPDWGNDLDSYYQFGVECVKSGRFDTEIPKYILYALKHIRNSGKKCGLSDSEIREYWESEKTGRILNTMYDGYAKSQYLHNSTYWLSNKAAVAWYCKRYKDAKLTIQALGSKADKLAFINDNDMPYGMVKEDAYFLSSAYGTELLKARMIRDNGIDKTTEALKIYESVYKKSKNDPPLSTLLKTRIELTKMRIEYSSGKWYNILPSPDLMDWSVLYGDWKINSKGYLEGKPDWYGATLLSYIPFSNRYEIKSKLHFTNKITECGFIINAPKLKPEWSASYTGVILQKTGIIRVNRQGLADSYMDIGNLKLSESPELLVRRWDDEISIFVDGKLVKKDIKLADGPIDKPVSVGVGGRVYDKDATIEFESMEVRYLKEKPLNN
ncbi:MAG: hypothetical protein ACYC27_07655 [Armatimonadota bacterium]